MLDLILILYLSNGKNVFLPFQYKTVIQYCSQRRARRKRILIIKINPQDNALSKAIQKQDLK